MMQKGLKWYQYTLRTLLLVTLLCSLLLSWFAVIRQRAKRQHDAVDVITRLHGLVSYDCDGLGSPNHRDPPYPKWLRDLLGDDFFMTVIDVSLGNSDVTEADLLFLESFPGVTYLDLNNTQVGDVALEYLTNTTKKLEHLDLAATKVTDAGLKNLRGRLCLRTLSLLETQVGNDGLSPIQGLVNLEMLELNESRVTDTDDCRSCGCLTLRERE